MNSTLKNLLSDFLRAGAIVAAVLAVVLANATSLNLPAQWVAYVSIAAGVVNALLGYIKPYASNLVAAARGKNK